MIGSDYQDNRSKKPFESIEDSEEKKDDQESSIDLEWLKDNQTTPVQQNEIKKEVKQVIRIHATAAKYEIAVAQQRLKKVKSPRFIEQTYKKIEQEKLQDAGRSMYQRQPSKKEIELPVEKTKHEQIRDLDTSVLEEIGEIELTHE